MLEKDNLSQKASHQRKRELKAILKIDRSVDELKDRYYKVSRLVLQYRGQNTHPIV